MITLLIRLFSVYNQCFIGNNWYLEMCCPHCTINIRWKMTNVAALPSDHLSCLTWAVSQQYLLVITSIAMTMVESTISHCMYVCISRLHIYKLVGWWNSVVKCVGSCQVLSVLSLHSNWRSLKTSWQGSNSFVLQNFWYTF